MQDKSGLRAKRTIEIWGVINYDGRECLRKLLTAESRYEVRAMWDTTVDAVTNVIDWTMQNILYINIIFSIFIVFFERREPQTVWTWLLVLYFIPIVGFLLYLLIGQDMHKHKMFKTKEIEDELNSAIRRQEEIIDRHEFAFRNPDMNRFSNLVYYNLEADNSVYTDDNDVEIYTNGRDKFRTLLEEIEKAEKYIHIQYYIIRNDEIWQKIEEALAKKAEQGVEVRVLFDSMGCHGMRARDWKRMRGEGIEAVEFFPAHLGRMHLRVNYRNHRKIVVIDGKTAFLGGFNIGREYLGLEKKFGFWRDTHMKITGSSVLSVHIRFILDWNYASKQNLFREDRFFELEEDYMPEGNTGMQIITSGPDSKYQEIRDNYLKLISKARDHIYIQTPYFIPDESVKDALIIAARSGVDVQIMIPCKPDHPFVYWATFSHIGDMLEAGAKCYTYDNGFLHSKGVMVDGLVSCYGTANMDIRSFRLNFEINATIYSEETTRQFEEIFKTDLEECTLVTSYLYAKRSYLIRFKEQFSRLLSPLL